MRTASRQTPTRKATCEGTIRIARSAKRRRPLSVAPKVIRVVDVEAGEKLPVERVRVRGLLPGDFWTATTEARWIQLTRLDESVEVRLTPQPAESRANVEIVNNDTGEMRVVRVSVRPASPEPQPVRPDAVDEKLDTTRRVELLVTASPPAVQKVTVDFTKMGLDNLIDQLIERLPGIRQAVLVTTDGLLVAAGGPMGRDDLDRLAAAAAGLRSGGCHLAAVAGGAPRHLVVDLDAGVVLLDLSAGEPFLALYAAADVDLGVAGHEMTLVTQALQARAAPAADWSRVPGPDHAKTSEPVVTEKSWLLDAMMRDLASNGLLGCVVASVDGMALATDRGFPFRAGYAAAATAFLLGSCRGVAAQVNGGRVRQVGIETRSGSCLVTPLGDSTVLVQFLTAAADVAASGYEATMMAERVGHYFF
jgi:predicted regulator of Ras-like GTPase activity (Roadblock/LC7/MglB family)